jgi:hypothetical protein
MKYISVVILLLVTISLNAQRRLSIGAYGGLGKSFNTEYTDYVYSQKAKIDYSYGLSLNLRLKDSIRLRLDGGVQRTSLKRDWPLAQDASIQAETSNLSVYYLDLNLRLDYWLYAYKKFNFYVSPGVKTIFSLGYTEKTDYTSGKTKTSNYLDIPYRRTLIAPSVELLVKYNLTKHIGLTLAPEYSYFFKEFYYKNNGNLSQFNVKLGVEFNF